MHDVPNTVFLQIIFLYSQPTNTSTSISDQFHLIFQVFISLRVALLAQKAIKT